MNRPSSRHLHRQPVSYLRNVLVAASGEIDDNDLVFAESGGALDNFGQRVSGLKRGDNAFQARQFHEGLQGLAVGSISVLDPVLVPQPGVFGPDGGVIKAG